MKAEPRDGLPPLAGGGIDRLIRNVEMGRFERSLSALAAAGARP